MSPWRSATTQQSVTVGRQLPACGSVAGKKYTGRVHPCKIARSMFNHEPFRNGRYNKAGAGILVPGVRQTYSGRHRFCGTPRQVAKQRTAGRWRWRWRWGWCRLGKGGRRATLRRRGVAVVNMSGRATEWHARGTLSSSVWQRTQLGYPSSRNSPFNEPESRQQGRSAMAVKRIHVVVRQARVGRRVCSKVVQLRCASWRVCTRACA